MLEVFFISKVRVKILKLYVQNPEKTYHVREIARQVSEEINAVRRELIHLEKEGLFRKEQKFNRVYYIIVPTYPLYDELRSMIFKQYALGGSIVKERENLGKINFAVLGSSYINSMPMNPNELDLLVIGDDVAMERLSILVKTVELDHGREINYAVLSPTEFSNQRKRSNGFVRSLIDKKKIFLIGSEDEFLS